MIAEPHCLAEKTQPNNDGPQPAPFHPAVAFPGGLFEMTEEKRPSLPLQQK
jgi:hypothetical protein